MTTLKDHKYFFILSLFFMFDLTRTASAQTFRSVLTHDSLLKVNLTASMDTLKTSDTLEVKVELTNAGTEDILILGNLWLKRNSNLFNAILHILDEHLKEVESPKTSAESLCIIPAMESPPSTILLSSGQFWGLTLIFNANDFPKSGIYYLYLNYIGCSQAFIKKLIKEGLFKQSDLHAPMKEYWYGEIRSNKIRFVVKK